MIVIGGSNGTQILNDIWLLDVSSLLAVSGAQDTSHAADLGTAGKGAKVNTKAKPLEGAPSSPSCSWVQLQMPSSVSMPPRCLHGCYSVKTPSSTNLYIFGGISSEIMTMNPYEISFAIGTTSPSIQACNVNNGSTIAERSYGFATTTVFENKNPSLIFALGGSSMNSSFLPLDCNSSMAQSIMEATQPKSPVKDALDEGNRSRVITYENGDIYEGEGADIVNEDGNLEFVRSGIGKMSYVNGDVYEGGWDRNLQNGIGQLSFDHTSSQYTGGFAENFFNGMGTLTLNQGDIVYRGDFVNGLYHGQGVLEDRKNGTQYEGDFQNGLRHGVGILREAASQQNIYEGSWVSDSPTGRGTLILEGGHIYTGDIVDGRPHGQGKCQYTNGNEYVGMWRSGKRNGIGSLSTFSLDVYEGKWVADMKCGKGVWRSKRGDIYDGIWNLDVPHGFGVVTYAQNASHTSPIDEISYAGEWYKGIRRGPGKITLADGTIVDFTFETNQINEVDSELSVPM
jgi:hypothetical protein